MRYLTLIALVLLFSCTDNGEIEKPVKEGREALQDYLSSNDSVSVRDTIK